MKSKSKSNINENIKIHVNHVKDSLYFKRLELLTKQSLRSQTFENLLLTLTSVAKTLAKTHRRLNDLKLSLDEGLSVINDHHAERLLQEMLSNAFKFSKKGNMVMVKWAFINTDAILEVHNEGTGLDKTEAEKIQEKLNHSHEGSQEKYWGLRIIKKITELYHANLSIETAIDKGWTIRVYFPDIIPLDEYKQRAAITGAPFAY